MYYYLPKKGGGRRCTAGFKPLILGKGSASVSRERLLVAFLFLGLQFQDSANNTPAGGPSRVGGETVGCARGLPRTGPGFLSTCVLPTHEDSRIHTPKKQADETGQVCRKQTLTRDARGFLGGGRCL